MALRVNRKSERAPWMLYTGDIIEVGSSHELMIDGDSNWISYKIATKVQEGETADEAHERAMGVLMDKVQDAVQRTVNNVQQMSD